MVHATEIEGYTYDGAVYCVPCARAQWRKAADGWRKRCTCESRDANGLCDSNCSGTGPNPVFAGDEGGDSETTCDTCGTVVQEALESDDSSEGDDSAEVCDFCERSKPCDVHEYDANLRARSVALSPSHSECDTHDRDDFDKGTNAFGMRPEDKAKLAQFQGYRLTLSEAERDAIDFAGDRYEWSNVFGEVLAYQCDSVPSMRDWNTSGPVTFLVPEHLARTLKEAAEADTAGGHDAFPLASQAFAWKLQRFVDSII